MEAVFCPRCDMEIGNGKGGCQQCRFVDCDRCGEPKPRSTFSNYSDKAIKEIAIIYCDDCLNEM